MMKLLFTIVTLAWCLVHSSAQAQEVDKSVITEEHTAGGDAAKRYFVIRHRLAPDEPPKEYGLLLVLPGGPGSADFLPFCANVITALGTPKDFIVRNSSRPYGER